MENFVMLLKREYINQRRKPISLVFGEKEHFLSSEQVIESHSNLKGLFTYVNPDFESFTGFREDELMGKPYGMIRHSDIPRSAFYNFYTHLKEARTRSCIVKNRTKDGGFYWVEERISAIYEGERHVGYRTLQYRPDMSDIQKVRYFKSTQKLQRHHQRVNSKQFRHLLKYHDIC